MGSSERLAFIFSVEELRRINVSVNKKRMMVVVDVHGLKTYEAKRFINNIINVIKTEFTLIVIHGYNHGTAIKDMLNGCFSNNHVKEKFGDSSNPGITYLLVA